jgi:2-polyprenyl-6-methoxyphenol hydroxylase-like FAD-dependent oxidoreductase
MRSCEVLVAGAGPTGLMLANWLTRLGVDVLVADGKEGPTRQSRALVVQARSLEIYDQLGVGDEVMRQAGRATALAPGFGPRVFGRIPLGAAGAGLTAYPWIEILEQSRNERILDRHLRELGGQVRWGAAVESVTEADGGVEARVGGETVRARFCVGADGAGSVVRESRKIDFAGVTNPHRFYVIDVSAGAGLVENAINVRPAGPEFLLAFPMAGRGNWRLIGLVEDADVTEDDIRPRLKRNFAVTWGDSRWFATYRVHHRVADRFRDGPFFLAGDAAHVHSPVGGQGMNTGLQDAHNLAFKLADVLRGRATDAWLDRYEAERRPVARILVKTTDRLFGLVTSQRPLTRLARTLVIPLAAPIGVRAVPRLPFFEYVSQIRIHYRTPGTDARDEVVGRRLPWTGDNFEVLKSLQWQVHGYGATPPPSLDMPFHGFAPPPETSPLRLDLLYLVRPDGFVAAAAPPSTATVEFRTRMGDLGLLK